MPFRTALSGLNASSTELRVIGHNIANASTVGFKKSRTEFADIFPASNLGTSSTTIGSGVKVSSVSQQFTQGNVNFTDNNLDLAISGAGFFIMNDNGINNYTRAGNFGVDNQGYVVNNQGHVLQAFQADTNGNITGARGDLQLDTSDIAPQATSNLDMGINVDASVSTPVSAFDPTDSTSYNNSTSINVYDSLGTPHLMTLYFRKSATANQWNVYSYLDGTAAANQMTFGGSSSTTVTFNTSGALTSANNVTLDAYPNPVPGTWNAGQLNMTLDLADVTQYGSPFSVNSLVQNGYSTGRLNGIDVAETGVVTARFTNGQSRTLAQVALANFSNPQGMRQLGDTSWAETFESGAPLVAAPGSGSLGLVQSGAEEGSNVDLTAQLVGMITAQRNFQANAQVITTADTITQTIINIR